MNLDDFKYKPKGYSVIRLMTLLRRTQMISTEAFISGTNKRTILELVSPGVKYLNEPIAY